MRGWMFWIQCACVHCWIVGHVSKHWRFYNRRDCYMLRFPTWIFLCKSYMRYSYFVGAAVHEWGLIIYFTYFGTLYMMKSPVFGFVITQHATIRSHARTTYSYVYIFGPFSQLMRQLAPTCQVLDASLNTTLGPRPHVGKILHWSWMATQI